MAWEKRKGSSKRYYTRTYRRTGKKCIRVYFGTGLLAELASTLDDIRRVEQELLRRDTLDLLGPDEPI